MLSAIALVIVSYLIYGCYDLLGRAYYRAIKLAETPCHAGVVSICYAFNLDTQHPVAGSVCATGCTRGWG